VPTNATGLLQPDLSHIPKSGLRSAGRRPLGHSFPNGVQQDLPCERLAQIGDAPGEMVTALDLRSKLGA
jgi:hypothetical protein